MSAPITIINVVAQSASVASPSSPGLYVPVHKRAGSNTSSSSRPSSPSSPDTPSPHVYSAATLLSLQPFADESMKGKIRVTCPEVVMTRKMRKGLEFNGRRTEVVAAQNLLVQAAPALVSDISAINNAMPTLRRSTTPAPMRVLTRRSRPADRAPERRRNPFASPFGVRRTGDDSWRLQAAVPMSPVLLV